MVDRLMPKRLQLGQHFAGCVGECIFHASKDDTPNHYGYRSVMGYFLPSWQRGVVWDDHRQVKLIESLWLGINIGTYTFNRSKDHGGIYDNLLIDGHQRMHSIERYIKDAFPVFGYRWSEVTRIDQRAFSNSSHFHAYITDSEDEQYLRNYYNMMNFGGVAHTEGQKA